VSRTKEILSQAAAAPLLTPAAACAEEQVTWARQERVHRNARTQAAAAEAAAPLLVMCGRCPIITSCRAWAVVEGYTGIAAGAAWAAGIERPAHWVPGHPPRQPRSTEDRNPDAGGEPRFGASPTSPESPN
jgi:hypothetical protein